MGDFARTRAQSGYGGVGLDVRAKLLGLRGHLPDECSRVQMGIIREMHAAHDIRMHQRLHLAGLGLAQHIRLLIKTVQQMRFFLAARKPLQCAKEHEDALLAIIEIHARLCRQPIKKMATADVEIAQHGDNFVDLFVIGGLGELEQPTQQINVKAWFDIERADRIEYPFDAIFDRIRRSQRDAMAGHHPTGVAIRTA